MSMQAEKQRRDYAERRVIIGDRSLSWDEFERYTKAVDDADAQRILDTAPLTPEAELQRAKKMQERGVRAAQADAKAIDFDAGVNRQMSEREAKIGARDMQVAYNASAGAPHHITPTPEEARRAQDAARRAQSIVEQAVGGWGGTAEALHREALQEAARQIAAEPLEAGMLGRGPLAGAKYGQAQGVAQMLRAPGKMFSREAICAIIRGQMAITHDSHLRDLLTIFENLE